ncbi:MAG: hypothetical protein OXE50_16320 [Chloroflexi bacterium]|nr:hypothetical protein [Chloroflexota bacterium]
MPSLAGRLEELEWRRWKEMDGSPAAPQRWTLAAAPPVNTGMIRVKT